MRKRYAAHLLDITGNAPQLVITFVYDQRAMEGPPFCVPDEEVHSHYAGHYKITSLSSSAVEGGLKGKTAATANVWLLDR